MEILINRCYEKEFGPPKKEGCDENRGKSVRYCVYYGHEYCTKNCHYALEIERRKNERERVFN
jgi:hypothetical protein